MKKYDFINLCDKTIISIETHSDGKRYVHYMGYGYDTGDKDDKPCRFVEYTFMYCELKKALLKGIFKWEDENQEFFKQYITDCSEEEMRVMYARYDNGNSPNLILYTAVNEETPDGIYILIFEDELNALKKELNGNLRHELNGCAGYDEEACARLEEKVVIIFDLIEEIEKTSYYSTELIVKRIRKSNNEENKEIFSDIFYSCMDIDSDIKDKEITGKLLNIWQKSKDKAAVEDMFYLFTGVTLVQYLGRCKNEMMKEN